VLVPGRSGSSGLSPEVSLFVRKFRTFNAEMAISRGAGYKRPFFSFLIEAADFELDLLPTKRLESPPPSILSVLQVICE